MGTFTIRNIRTGRVALKTDSWDEVRSFVSTRLHRLMNRDGLSHSEALNTVNAQVDISTED